MKPSEVFWTGVAVALLAAGLCSCLDAGRAYHPVDTRHAAIINGRPATETDFPGVGTILFSGVVDPTGLVGKAECTGTLIAPDAVLTAGHCAAPIEGVSDLQHFFTLALDVEDYAGERDQQLPPRTAKVMSFRVHPDYVDANNQPDRQLADARDLALAFLDTPVVLFHDPIFPPEAPMPMAAQDATGPLGAGRPVTIVGYGKRSYDSYNDSAAPAGVKYLAETTIAEWGAAEFRVGAAEPDPMQCRGDSGGPVLSNEADPPGSWVIVGVGSRAYDRNLLCRGGIINTRVDALSPWIHASLQEACDNGERHPSCRAVPQDDPGGGCATSSSGAGVGALGLLAVLALRRRGLTRRKPNPCPVTLGAGLLLLFLCAVGASACSGAGDCQRGCDRMAECQATSGSQDQCLAACLAVAGLVSEDQSSMPGCLECLETSECDQIRAGGCVDACRQPL